jgi:hypothetical protein
MPSLAGLAAEGSGAVIKLGELVMILDLHRQGLSVPAIARQLCVDRKTVRRAIAKGLEPPKYKTRPPRSRIADPFEPPSCILLPGSCIEPRLHCGVGLTPIG